MTELTPASRQNGRFHETRMPNAEVRWLVDEWHDALQLLTTKVAVELGIPTPFKQLQEFSAPCDYAAQTIDDPRALLGPVFERLQTETPADLPATEARTAALLGLVFNKQLCHMREWWHDGYFARTDRTMIDGKNYHIYNHQPAFAFTGKIHRYQARNLRTGTMDWWLYAELNRAPLTDETGDFVPAHPHVPVTVLPAPLYEPVATRELANAHLDALRASLAPWVVQAYAPNLRGTIAPRLSPLERVLAQFAMLAPEHF